MTDLYLTQRLQNRPYGAELSVRPVLKSRKKANMVCRLCGTSGVRFQKVF